MKTLFFLFVISLSAPVFSQNIVHIQQTNSDEEFDNISIKKLDSDSNSTSFIIWVKKGVKSHKHETHSELIYVVDGEGMMTIDKNTYTIRKGDYFRIPQNTFHALKVTSKTPMKVVSVQSPEFFGKDRIFEEKARK